MGNLAMTLEELGYQEEMDEQEGEDRFRLVTGDELNHTGTSSLKGKVKLKPLDLFFTFGKPTSSDSYKVSGAYCFQHRSGEYLHLYEWCNTNLLYEDGMDPVDFWKQDKEIEFHIGASTGWYTEDLSDWIKNEIIERKKIIDKEGYL
tara:strand:- start:875 stop:1315 length:441 start_codon:yes stop_codon:yes gene_type:complete